MRYAQIINSLKEKTEVTPEDNPGKELWKVVMRALGYTAVITAMIVYLMLYLIFYVVGAAWRRETV
jgi:uncharacterized protein (DUF2062 family)